MSPAENILLSLTIALAITFVAVCVGIYYTHTRMRVLKQMNDSINHLLDVAEKDEELNKNTTPGKTDKEPDKQLQKTTP